jgi:hypothetical protein
MKLTTTTQVSVDGVMQGPGGPDENRRGVFERRGWARLLFDNEAMTFVHFPKGITIQVYRPTGRPQYATATAD